MSLIERFAGVFFSPQAAFRKLSENRVWVDALVVVLICVAVYGYLVAPFINQDTLKAYRENIKFQERLGKERYERMMKGLENPTTAGILVRNVALPLVFFFIGLLVTGLIILIIGRTISTEGTFALVFTAVVHASFIDKVLGAAVRLILVFMRKSVVQTSTSLALLAPNVEFTSPAYIILSQFDFFQLWMFGVLGYGLAAIFKVSLRKGMLISYGFWAVKSLVYIALGFLTRTLMG